MQTIRQGSEQREGIHGPLRARNAQEHAAGGEDRHQQPQGPAVPCGRERSPPQPDERGGEEDDPGHDDVGHPLEVVPARLDLTAETVLTIDPADARDFDDAISLERIENGQGRDGDLTLLKSVADNIEGNTICALGEAAAWPVQSFVKKFNDEFQAHIDAGKCVVLDVQTAN